MANESRIAELRGFCPPPFFALASFPETGGFVDGRLCQTLGEPPLALTCCLPCPLVEFVYPDNFSTLTEIANWVSVVSTIATAFLLASWAFLPVEKTHRHYLTISLTSAVVMMNLGFIVPLAAQPDQCFNEITPHGMESSPVCAASGTFLVLGGWAGVMWAFLRSVNLHLQICWQKVVGKPFMIFAHVVGWGVPIVGVTIALVLSGVSFRFGETCHINHKNSLADFWIPLLIFAGLTVVLTFITFGYCIKVYLASLADQSATTEGSSTLPSYQNSLRTMTPRQAYRRVRRVIELQWRGIAIVLIIIADVIFFSIVFVFQDNTIEAVQTDASLTEDWLRCLLVNDGDKNQCLNEAKSFVLDEGTVTAVLLLLSLNGIFLLFLTGRLAMLKGWVDLFKGLFGRKRKKEFVSVDARIDDQKDTRSYEMLSRGSSAVVTPVTPVKSPSLMHGRRTPDYFGSNGTSARYQVPARSFSSPRPPQSPTFDNTQRPNYYRTSTLDSAASMGTRSPPMSNNGWETRQTYANPNGYEDMNPLGMNRI